MAVILLMKILFEDIFDDVRYYLSVGMAKLAADNLVECAWDDDKK